MKRRILASLLGLCLGFAAPGQGSGQATAQAGPGRLDPVRLQLKWRHQFQFAGYYMAKAKGFYADEGLDVTIAEANPDTRFTDEVVSGRSQYGINNSDLLIDRSRGKRVVVLGVIFQHSPLVLLSLASRGIDSPADLIGKRVMVSKEAEAETFSTLTSEAIPTSRIQFLDHSWNLEDLIQGRTDVVTAYTTNEALILKERGIDYRMLRPLSYGIDFYGDCLFTSEAELSRHPKRAAAFLRASLKGWDYALGHVDEACDLILSDYSRAKTKAELRLEAGAMEDLILHKLVPLGSMNPGRWRHIADTYAKLDSLPEDFGLEGFLYDPAASRIDPRVLRIILGVAVVLSGLALAYIYVLRRFNHDLASQVSARTRTLEEVNSTLAREVEAGRAKEEALAINLAEREVLLREVHHRVKNNLQIIASLVNLEIRAVDSTCGAESLLNIRNRVLGMSLAHEQLYSADDLSLIGMDSYFRDLASEIVFSTAPKGLQVSVLTRTDNQRLSLEEAIPLGLIVGELLTNCVKHAFPSGGRGELVLSLEGSADDGPGHSCKLTVADNGVGETAGETKGIGLQLVESLSIQLGGRLETRIEAGRKVSLEFRPQAHRGRA